MPEIIPDPSIGRRIGPYEILQRLGAGGMGNVYRAAQVEPIRRTVALKLIRRGLDTEETIRRFQRERQVLAALNHPNIARLLDGGTTDDGLPYFVMEYVEGEPITAYCDHNGLTTRQRLCLFQRVCAAVHYAHQNTVIHRDLKPANILVGAGGELKLLDFGIAKMTNRDSSLQTLNPTRPENRLMTPEYASPEQLRGETITTATDVYSLGLILYELLTGCLPYPLTGGSKQETDRLVLTESELPRPSDTVRRRVEGSQGPGEPAATPEMIANPRGVSPEQLRRQLRGDIDNIVLVALRKEPSRRYASAEQFSADIERHLRHEPVLAAPPGALYRVRKFARRNKATCALAVAICLGLIGSTGGTLWAMKAREVARMAEQAAAERAERLRRATYAKELTLASFDLRGNVVGSMKRRLRDVPPDLRDWGWDYLNAMADNSLQTWTGHVAEVRALAVRPDGQRVASGDAEGWIRLWDPQSGTTVGMMHGHRGPVNSVEFSPDGGRLASGGSDGTVCIWDPSAGSSEISLDARAGAVVSVRFRSGGEGVAAGYADDKVRLWDIPSRGVTRTLPGFDGRFDSLAFSPDGRFLAGAGTGNRIEVWPIEAGAEARTLARYNFPVCASAFSLDSRLFAASQLNGSIQLWDVAGWARLRTEFRRLGLTSPSPLAFSPDSKRLASVGFQGRILTLWALPKGTSLRNFHGHDGVIRAAAFSPDGQWVVTGSADHTLKVWDGNPTKQLNRFREHRAAVSGLAFSPDGRMILSGDDEGGLACCDADTHRVIRRLLAPAEHVRCLAFTSDARSFVTGGTDGTVVVWSAATGVVSKTFRAHEGPVNCLTGSPHAPLVVSGGADGLVKLWDAGTGQQLRAFEGHRASVRCVAISPDGRSIASSDADGTIRLWEVGAGSCIRALCGPHGAVRSVFFSPDGRRIASGGDDAIVRLWDTATGAPVLTLEGLHSPVVSVSFSPSSRCVIAACADGTIRFFDAISGGESLSFHDHDASVTCLTLSPDGRTVVSGGAGGLLAFMRAEPYAVEAQIEREEAARAAQAEALLDSLYARTGDWEQVAEALRADPGLSALLRHRALNAILTRSSRDLVHPATNPAATLPQTEPEDLEPDPEHQASRLSSPSLRRTN
ncbi:MAG TPA: protein kinase [Phycisphaerae bacterium]|nr:protein kinase [Phycisphaerae bacterium]HRY69493.1 protein kinase [Phycisphaerae bacterium]